ncbi:MAG: hypothetical protein ACRENE_35535 [Polyangiaceae bacterium]
MPPSTPETGTVVFLRQTFYVQQLHLTDGAELQVAQPRTLRLTVRPFTEAETKLGHSSGGAADAYWHHTAPPKAYAELVRFADGQLDEVQTDGTRVMPNPSQLAKALQEFGRMATDGVGDVVQRYVCALRWRVGIDGPHSPLSVGLPQWSNDEATWRRFPLFGTRVLGFSGGSAPRLSNCPTELAEVASGLEEPVYHSLFREAWSQRTSNRRSALVIGLAAAEIATKTTLAGLAPTAEWLILNLPSPPLDRMLRKAIPSAMKAAGRTLRFNMEGGKARVLEDIRNGITQRNECVHQPGSPPDFDNVVKFLLAVRDVLFMCDVYAGHDWALARIRKETLEEWSAT